MKSPINNAMRLSSFLLLLGISHAQQPTVQWVVADPSNGGVAGLTLGAGEWIYVSGMTDHSFNGQPYAGNYDFFLLKYDKNGVHQWSRIWGTSGQDFSFGGGLATDGQNIYMAGWSLGTISGQPKPGSADYCLTKFDVSGTKQWIKMWGSTRSDSHSIDVGVDAGSNAYVIGCTEGSFDGEVNASSPGVDNFSVTKMTTSGESLWTRIWGPTNTGGSLSPNIAVAGNGNVFAFGVTKGSYHDQTNTSEGLLDFSLTCFDASGSRMWTRIWGSPYNEDAYGITLDGTSCVYVVGSTEGAFQGQPNSGARDCVLSKISTEGTVLWTKVFGSQTNDLLKSVAVSPVGSVLVAGSMSGAFNGQTSAGSNDNFLAEFTSSGSLLWSKLWGTASDEQLESIAIYSNGSIYVTGKKGTWPTIASQITKLSPGINWLVDSDGDGISDYNETYTYYTSPSRRDTDGDGMSDWQEIIARTDPTSATSKFCIAEVSNAQRGSFSLSWTASTGRLYSVCSRGKTDTLWTTNLSRALGVSGTMSYTNYVSAPSCLFRLSVQMP